MRQMLRRAGDEAHVSNTGPTRVPFRGRNGLRVGIDTVNPGGKGRDAQREAAIAAPEVQDSLPAYKPGSTPLPELVERTRPEGRRKCGNVPANIANRVRRDSAHRCRLNLVGASEIRASGLLVTNRT
jgi:hypothetical protein